MSISAHIEQVRQAIAAAAQAAGRDPKSVSLIAVSKTFGSEAVIAAADAGLLRTLADDHELAAGARISAAAMRWLHRWYSAGFLLIGRHPGSAGAPTLRNKTTHG